MRFWRDNYKKRSTILSRKTKEKQPKFGKILCLKPMKSRHVEKSTKNFRKNPWYYKVFCPKKIRLNTIMGDLGWVFRKNFFERQAHEKFPNFSCACVKRKRKILFEKAARTSLNLCFIILLFTSRTITIIKGKLFFNFNRLCIRK